MTKPCTKAIPVYDATIDLNVGPEYRNAVEVARHLCSTCPVWRECLVENRDVEGVVAGLTLAERTRRTPPVKRETCGKTYGSNAHRRRNEAPCDECKAAEAARARRRKEAAA
jgi:hypothetical protein